MPDLFPETKPARKSPRIMMHLTDAGDAGSGHDCFFECQRCGHKAGWMPVQSVSDAKRGRPCPICNQEGEPEDIAAGYDFFDEYGMTPQEYIDFVARGYSDMMKKG